MIVKKYGGTSVETINKIKTIANTLKNELATYKKIIVVVSAMGKTTNQLLSLAQQITDNSNSRELDQLLSTGEIQSASLLSIALKNIRVKSISLTAPQLKIKTNSNFGNALVKTINIEILKEYLKKYDVIVITGFQGVDKNHNTTTLGRGGSDTTATLLAGLLKCDCEIFTDVNGIYTVDPNIYKNAKKLNAIGYNQIITMSSNGAKVMETRSLLIAKKYNTTVYVGKNEENIQKMGTKISNTNIENMQIYNLSSQENIYKLTLKTYNFNHLFKIFRNLSKKCKVEILSIIKKNNHIEASFIIDKQNKALTNFLKKEGIKYTISNLKTKLTICGNGFQAKPSLVNFVFKIFAKSNINFSDIKITDLSISFLIANTKKKKVISLLAKKFRL